MRTAQGAITRDKVAAIKAEYVRQFVAYEQIDRGHALRVILDNPLPTRDGGRVGYSLAFDAFQRLIEGVATVTRNGDDISVEWNHSRPDWALGYRFTSNLRAIRTSGYELTVTPTSR